MVTATGVNLRSIFIIFCGRSGRWMLMDVGLGVAVAVAAKGAIANFGLGTGAVPDNFLLDALEEEEELNA